MYIQYMFKQYHILISVSFLFSSLSLRAAAVTSRVCCFLPSCVSLRFFSSLLLFSSFICCLWGAHRWKRVNGDRIEGTITVCMAFIKPCCWGTSPLAICPVPIPPPPLS